MKDSNVVRILHVISSLDCGGAQEMIMNLYRNINRNKVQYDFIIDKECSHYVKEVKLLGGKIYRLTKFNGWNYKTCINEWKNFLKTHKEYIIIHGHVRSSAVIYLSIAKKHGRIAIMHSHNTSSGNNFQAKIIHLLHYPIRYIADYLFACSKEAGMWLYGNKCIHNQNFKIISNAIDVEKYKYDFEKRTIIRRQLQIENKFAIGHVGRFYPQKNHSFIIKIFEQVCKIDKNSILILIGDGELFDEIKSEAKERNLLDNIIFFGVRRDVPDLLQALDLFILPSLYEGLGIVLIEAQAAGIYSIVSDKIPDEAIITDLVKKVSLDETAEKWAYRLLDFKGKEHLDKVQEVIKKGYDIKESADNIECLYLKIANERKKINEKNCNNND